MTQIHYSGVQLFSMFPSVITTSGIANGSLQLREGVDDLYLRGQRTGPTILCALKFKGISRSSLDTNESCEVPVLRNCSAFFLHFRL
jgi:hypothetical protein